MRSVGIHIRFMSDIASVLEKAERYQIDIFQCFFVDNDHKYIPLSQQTIQRFHQIRDLFTRFYAHSSFMVNLADHRISYHPYLHKELARAKALGFSHLVLHPGAAGVGATKEEALETVIRRINTLMKQENDIKLLLENSAHTKRNLGGDLHDLYYIRSRLDKPEKVGFCLDTAHAHVFGYDLIDDFQSWIEEVERLLGSIELLHLNDTKELPGSCQDRHALLGNGVLGDECLKRHVDHPFFKDIPIVLELPVVSEKEELEVLDRVKSWL